MFVSIAFVAITCRLHSPPPWDGPVLTQPRTELTVDQLLAGNALPFLDMSFFARPTWAQDSPLPFSGSIALREVEMVFPKARDAYKGEDTFPKLTVDFVSHRQRLIPAIRGVIDTRADSGSYWDVALGTGAVWQEPGDREWSRASFPFNLLARYVGEVRNCVGTFVYKQDAISNVAVQCSQETAVLDAQQLGNIRAMVPAAYQPAKLADAAALLADYQQAESSQIPTVPLSEIDRAHEIAGHFDTVVWTNASTSLGAVYVDGTLCLHPPRTHHGIYPYPGAMRHGVFSVTKSMAGALAMFYFAERYGEEIFEERIADHVPAFADLPEWKGVTFSHTLNMVTGVRAGEDLLYEPLELAPNKEAAIRNIAQFGDFPEAPGEKFNYATTNTFVLSYALENYVNAKEGDGVHYWDLVVENVLKPIGAGDFGLLYTRDEDPSHRIPILGLGAFPTLDHAAKIARLLFNEGEHEGAQLLNRQKVREALGRTGWSGYSAFSGLRYRHSFWAKDVQAGGCSVEVSYMEGLGDNRVIFFPSGLISFQFTDEFDKEIDRLVRAIERVRSSCR